MQANYRPLGSRYRLFEEIGRGAMGSVWRGEATSGTPVAVKILLPDLASDPMLVQRFVGERSVLTGVRHPNVVEVLDLVVEGDTLGIVMEYVPGANLRTLLSRAGTLAPQQVAQIGACVADGLAAIHARRIVHRDVKPENVLVTQLAPPVVKLTDFGISRLDDEASRNRRTVMVGTPFYMAPELGLDAPPSFSTDLYALGIMLYELTCGVTPFQGSGAWAVMRAHAETEPPIPPHFPPRLWELVSGLLAKDPQQRLGGAQVVADRLNEMAPSLAALAPMTPLQAPLPTKPSATPLRYPLTWGDDLAPRSEGGVSGVPGVTTSTSHSLLPNADASPAGAAADAQGNPATDVTHTIYSPFSMSEFLADNGIAATGEAPASLIPSDAPGRPRGDVASSPTWFETDYTIDHPILLDDFDGSSPDASEAASDGPAWGEPAGHTPKSDSLSGRTVLASDWHAPASSASQNHQQPGHQQQAHAVPDATILGLPTPVPTPVPGAAAAGRGLAATPTGSVSVTSPASAQKPKRGRRIATAGVAAAVLLGGGLIVWHPWSRSSSTASNIVATPPVVGDPTSQGIISPRIDKAPPLIWTKSMQDWYRGSTDRGGLYPGILKPELRNAWIQYATDDGSLKVRMVDLSNSAIRWSKPMQKGPGRCGGGPSADIGCVTTQGVWLLRALDGKETQISTRRVGLGTIGAIAVDSASNVYVASGDGKNTVRVDKVSADGSKTWSWQRTGIGLESISLQVLGPDLLVKVKSDPKQSQGAGTVLRLSDGSAVENLDKAVNLQAWGDRLLVGSTEAQSDMYNLDGLRIGGLLGNRFGDEPDVMRGTATAFDVPQSKTPVVTSWNGNQTTYVYDRSAKLAFSMVDRAVLGQCNNQLITATGGLKKGELYTIDARSLDGKVLWTYNLKKNLVQTPALICDGTHVIVGYRPTNADSVLLVGLNSNNGSVAWQTTTASSDPKQHRPTVLNVAGRGGNIIGYADVTIHAGKSNQTSWLVVTAYR